MCSDLLRRRKSEVEKCGHAKLGRVRLYYDETRHRLAARYEKGGEKDGEDRRTGVRLSV